MKLRKNTVFAAVTVLLFVFFAAFSAQTASAAADIEINETNFPDPQFRTYVRGFDLDKNGSLSSSERSAVTEISIDEDTVAYVEDVWSLKGIEFFTSLKILNCSYTRIETLDLHANTKLEELYCGNTYIETLDLNANTKLRELVCFATDVRSLDLSRQTELLSLTCYNCPLLTSLNLNANTKLDYLDCGYCSLTSLDVTKNTDLTSIGCAFNPLTSLNLYYNTELVDLGCYGCNLSTLNLSRCTKLESLDCSRNPLTQLDLRSQPDLTVLRCEFTCITENDLLLASAVKSQKDACTRRLCTVSKYGDEFYDVWVDGIVTNVAEFASGDFLITVDAAVASGGNAHVYFCLNTGDEGAPDTITAKLGSTVTIPSSSVSNYTAYFMGWSHSPTTTTATYKTGDTLTLTKDVVLFAVWKPKRFSVTFDLNGGTSGAPAKITGKLCTERFVIPKSSPVREGYYFLGWAISDEATQPDYVSGDWDYCYCDYILYAVWSPRKNKISFNANGGAGLLPKPIVTYTAIDETIPSASLTRSGYWFLGWSTDKNAAKATYKSGSVITVTKDTVLYAVWKSDSTAKCRLSYDRNGGGGNAPTAVEVNSGTKVTIPKASVSRTGHYFLGWATTRSATSPQYKSGDVLTVTKTTVLYAVWKKQTVTLSFDRNGGSGNAPAKITTTYGSTVTVAKCSVSRDGYYFLGWSKTQGATTATYKSGSTLTLNGSVRLYAVWKKK